ncbi:hypothetical protein MGAST_27585 [Mycobacterium gastri 'Wayne']|nr:hypothetical protein MGAST_27585 [Mycobacterium gastri 'Wayne']
MSQAYFHLQQTRWNRFPGSVSPVAVYRRVRSSGVLTGVVETTKTAAKPPGPG